MPCLRNVVHAFNAQLHIAQGANGRRSRVGDQKEKDDDDELLPRKNRGCRDCICLLLFLAYVGFMAWLFVDGLTSGRFRLLIRCEFRKSVWETELRGSVRVLRRRSITHDGKLPSGGFADSTE